MHFPFETGEEDGKKPEKILHSHSHRDNISGAQRREKKWNEIEVKGKGRKAEHANAIINIEKESEEGGKRPAGDEWVEKEEKRMKIRYICFT